MFLHRLPFYETVVFYRMARIKQCSISLSLICVPIKCSLCRLVTIDSQMHYTVSHQHHRYILTHLYTFFYKNPIISEASQKIYEWIERKILRQSMYTPSLYHIIFIYIILIWQYISIQSRELVLFVVVLLWEINKHK